MMCRPTSGLLLAAVLLIATPASAQQARLAEPDARIGDRTIQADHATYEAMQARIKAENDRGTPVSDYRLSKAQCWLDVSFHEYTRNDRSAFPQAALTESEKLVAALEAKQSPMVMDTPLVNGAARVRPDLWSKVEDLQRRSGFRCASQKTACAEVELVHAGNEYNQQQWRHATPYVQIAEDLLADADRLASRCEAPVAPSVAVTVPTAVSKEDFLSMHVVFRFDGSGRSDIVPASIAQLNGLIARLKASGGRVVSIRLVGNADRLNGTKDAQYNQRLSIRRSETVRDLLVSKGVDGSLLDTTARGDRQPIEPCSGSFGSTPELEACLLPNRRVDVEVRVQARVVR